MIFNKKNNKKNNKQTEEITNKKQIGLEIKLPECDDFVPIGKSQYKQIFSDDLGPRLLIVADECAELLEASGVKTEEGKEEDALKAEMDGLIKSITQLGRSSGIHMILAPLRLSTLIPTTKGYKTMENIKVGDYVFDRDNKPTKVIGLSEIKMSEEMYEIILQNTNNSSVDKYQNMTIGSDYQHRFPVMIKKFDKIINLNKNENKYCDSDVCTAKEIYELTEKGYTVYIKGSNDDNGYQYLWHVENIIKIPNELVRCIEIESPNHLFMITDTKALDWKGGERYKYAQLSILTHNTQRNDARIISGTIQNNPLALETKVCVLRNI